MKYSSIIFDLDGTLLDTLADLKDSLNTVLQSFGLPTRSIEEIGSFVGDGMRVLVKRAAPSTDKDTEEKLYLAFCQYYQAHCNDSTRPYPHIIELLQQLKKEGVRLAVVSNKDASAAEKLVDYHFSGIFDVVLGVNVGIRKKPYPDMLLSAIEALGGDAVYVGDSEVDILSCKNAGIPCISVSWGFRTQKQLVQNGATVIISDPMELLEKSLF